MPIEHRASKSAGKKGDVPKIYGFVHLLHPLPLATAWPVEPTWSAGDAMAIGGAVFIWGLIYFEIYYHRASDSEQGMS